jgi:hypothetical protein
MNADFVTTNEHEYTRINNDDLILPLPAGRVLHAVPIKIFKQV